MDANDILLIDDDADTAALIAHALRDLPGEQLLVHFLSAAAAVAWLTANGVRLGPGAFALLEPQRDDPAGGAAIAALRAVPGMRALPIIVLTGDRDPNHAAASYRNGANSVVFKPFDPTEFRSIVQHVVGYWILVNTGALRCEA